MTTTALLSPSTTVQDHTCAIYSLNELGVDADLGKWIAETIPDVIEPGSWNREDKSGKKRVLRYYGPKNILVVYHTAAVQAKVDGFLKSMKKALPAAKERTVNCGPAFATDPGVARARYLAPELTRTAHPAPEHNLTYPVPAPARQPKHLFHFIIRYEGAGIIDSNVIKYMKIQNGSNAPESSEPAGKDKESTESLPPSPAAIKN